MKLVFMHARGYNYIEHECSIHVAIECTQISDPSLISRESQHSLSNLIQSGTSGGCEACGEVLADAKGESVSTDPNYLYPILSYEVYCSGRH